MADEVAAFRISGISLSVQRSAEQLKGNLAFIKKYAEKKEYGIKRISAMIGKIKSVIFFFVKQVIYFYLRITGR
jgi:hypothetical protein